MLLRGEREQQPGEEQMSPWQHGKSEVNSLSDTGQELFESEGGKEQAELTPSWKKKETPSCTFSELWTRCLVARGITYL